MIRATFLSNVAMLLVHCATCGHPITLRYRPDRFEIPASAWNCPWPRCTGVLWSDEIGGTILAVWPGHGPEREATA